MVNNELLLARQGSRRGFTAAGEIIAGLLSAGLVGFVSDRGVGGEVVVGLLAVCGAGATASSKVLRRQGAYRRQNKISPQRRNTTKSTRSAANPVHWKRQDPDKAPHMQVKPPPPKKTQKKPPIITDVGGRVARRLDLGQARRKRHDELRGDGGVADNCGRHCGIDCLLRVNSTHPVVAAAVNDEPEQRQHQQTPDDGAGSCTSAERVCTWRKQRDHNEPRGRAS